MCKCNIEESIYEVLSNKVKELNSFEKYIRNILFIY